MGVSSFYPHLISVLPAAGEVPAVKAYDTYVKTAVVPFCQACDDLGGLKNTADLVREAWEGVRTVIVLASRSKLPDGDVAQALSPHLASTQEALKSLRGLRLDRDWDRHQKAIQEMVACLSWVLMRAPQSLPVPMIKEAVGSAEFWSNRIRKDYKGKDDKQIAFCDSLKKVITGLADYVEENHKTGLTFSPRGVSLAEASIRLSDEAPTAPAEGVLKSPTQKRHPTLGTTGGNMAGLMGELNKRKTADGSSAATGLKKVRLCICYHKILSRLKLFLLGNSLIFCFCLSQRSTEISKLGEKSTSNRTTPNCQKCHLLK